MGRGGDRVGVPLRGFVEAGGGAGGLRELGGGRGRGAVTADDPVEGVDGGELLVDAGQELFVGVGLFGDEVDVVLGPAAGEHRVEQLPVLVSGEDAVHDVGGGALGGVDGGGVAELDMLGDVRRWKRDVQARPQVPRVEAAVSG